MKDKRIKDLKPSKKSRYKQGYVNPKSCKKLFESQQNEPIIYRSSYEKKFIRWLELSDKVVHWGSECVRIPYTGVDGQPHHYYPDYMVEFANGIVCIIEVKPYSQVQVPDPRCLWAVDEFKKNVLKWRAAADFCKKHGMYFKVITERTINSLKISS